MNTTEHLEIKNEENKNVLDILGIIKPTTTTMQFLIFPTRNTVVEKLLISIKRTPKFPIKCLTFHGC